MSLKKYMAPQSEAINLFADQKLLLGSMEPGLNIGTANSESVKNDEQWSSKRPGGLSNFGSPLWSDMK